MERTIYNADHDLFRRQFHKFLETEVVPNYEQWEKDGMVSREIWQKAADMGYLCPWLPEEYGGLGVDFLYDAIMIEETSLLGNTGWDLHLQNEVCVPYIFNFGTEEQKQKYLPGCVSGKWITALGLTEPDAGSDVSAIRTTAVKDGDDYIINGNKTFISTGILNTLVIIAAKTDTKVQPAYKGVSLFLVEGDNPGYKRGRHLEKMGRHSQDTAELTFEDCRVPKSALLGGVEGQGFKQIMKELQQERLLMSIRALGYLWRILAMTKEYINSRKVFGQLVSEYQNTRFKMAEMYTMAEMCQAFLDNLTVAHVAGKNVDVETAMAKWYSTEALNKVAYQCLQFFGGYGYMEEYPICRAYRDARVETIMGGTTEIMKEIIGRAVLR